jgi:hypothetical protein
MEAVHWHHDGGSDSEMFLQAGGEGGLTRSGGSYDTEQHSVPVGEAKPEIRHSQLHLV